MNRLDEVALLALAVDMSLINASTAPETMDAFNLRISETLSIEHLDYVRDVNDAIKLIPLEWSAEITWDGSPSQSRVSLFRANPLNPEQTINSHSEVGIGGVRGSRPLPIAITISALSAHALEKKHQRQRNS